MAGFIDGRLEFEILHLQLIVLSPQLFVLLSDHAPVVQQVSLYLVISLVSLSVLDLRFEGIFFFVQFILLLFHLLGQSGFVFYFLQALEIQPDSWVVGFSVLVIGFTS